MLKIWVSLLISRDLKLTYLFLYCFICELKILHQILSTCIMYFPFAFLDLLSTISQSTLILVVDMCGLCSVPSAWVPPVGGSGRRWEVQGGERCQSVIPPYQIPSTKAHYFSQEAISIHVPFQVSVTNSQWPHFYLGFSKPNICKETLSNDLWEVCHMFCVGS